MSSREIEMFLFDVYIAILKIEKISLDFSNAQDLLYDFRSWDSVIREFEIIGEASKYLLKEELLHKDYRKVVDFRNYITHAYFGIDEEQVWNIIHNDLKNLKKIIENSIRDIPIELNNELINSFIEDNSYLKFIINDLNRLRKN